VVEPAMLMRTSSAASVAGASVAGDVGCWQPTIVRSIARASSPARTENRLFRVYIFAYSSPLQSDLETINSQLLSIHELPYFRTIEHTDKAKPISVPQHKVIRIFLMHSNA
jgi:hypothetical protein